MQNQNKGEMNREEIQGEIDKNDDKNGNKKQMKQNKIINEICKTLDIGCIMRLILMQNQGIKIVEEIIKVIRKMKNNTFIVKQKMDFSMQFIKKYGIMKISQELLQQLENEAKNNQKSAQKQNGNENNQNFRQQMIQKIVEELYNARQNAIKLQQSELNQNMSGTSESKEDTEKEIKEYFSSITRKQSENSHLEIAQLKKIIDNLENEGKAQNKIIQESNRTILEKEEKIQSLKNTISKLEQHIIRQVKLQGETQMKVNSNQTTSIPEPEKLTAGLKAKSSIQSSSLIKSQALQREVSLLKKEIENLRNDLSKSAQILSQKDNQLVKMSMKCGINQELEKQKEIQFMALSRQYTKVKEEVSLIINENKTASQSFENLFGSEQQQTEESDNCIMLKAQLQITSQKCKKLQKLYLQLKEEYNKIVDKSRKEHPVLKKNSSNLISSNNDINEEGECGMKHEKHRKEKGKSRYLASKIGQVRKVVDMESDDQQIMRDIKEISKMQKLSSSMSISNFQSLINPVEMAAKIQGFDFNNSIIHKINSSKFIQSFQAKLSFILQYTCMLELYFNKSFLSCLREELMMESNLDIKPISNDDLNPQHYVAMEQNSFTNNNNISKLSNNSSKMFINNQFSISQYANSNSNMNPNKTKETSQELSQSAASLPNPSISNSIKQAQKRAKMQKLQNQLKQISSLIPNQYLNPHQLRDDPQFVSRLQKIRHNGIAQIITNLIKENEVFKKCLNQMIKNQQNFTRMNNQIYFDQDGELRRRSSSTDSIIKLYGTGEEKRDNCLIM